MTAFLGLFLAVLAIALGAFLRQQRRLQTLEGTVRTLAGELQGLRQWAETEGLPAPRDRFRRVYGTDLDEWRVEQLRNGSDVL